MQNNLLNNKLASDLNGIQEIEPMVQNLRNLPKVVVPLDFDHKLKSQLQKPRETKSTGFFEKIFFPPESYSRILVYSTVVVLVLCSIFLSYIVLRNGNMSNLNESIQIDSGTYQGKKVIIIPPAQINQSNQTAQQPLKKLLEPDKKELIRDENINKYFTPPSTTDLEKQRPNGAVEESKSAEMPSAFTKTTAIGIAKDSSIHKTDSLSLERTKKKEKTR